jgi:hypothetical protein
VYEAGGSEDCPVDPSYPAKLEFDNCVRIHPSSDATDDRERMQLPGIDVDVTTWIKEECGTCSGA